MRIVAIVAIVLILVLSALQLTQSSASGATTPSATAGAGTVTPIAFPTVPAGGTTLQFAKTYIHPTGLFAISQPLGWSLPPSAEENTNTTVSVTQGAGTPASGQLIRAGVTFIDNVDLSVLHVYVEHDSINPPATVQDLDKSYNTDYFNAAWGNFTGGYKETARSTDNNLSVVSFTLSLNGNTYLGRQISTIDHGWIKAVRLVTPDNNAGLMDKLQTTVWPTLQLFSAELTTPLKWPAVVDSVYGYVIRYEPGWTVQTGTPGTPFVISGPLSGTSITMTTNAEQGKQIGSEADVRAWVKAQNASATVQTVQPTTINGTAGFNVSYQTPDADGNVRSAVSTLLNGANKLITATFVSSAAKVDMLGTVGVPPDLVTMRSSFLIIPSNTLVPTLTPTITPTASITPTGADTLTSAANQTLTANAPTLTATNTVTATNTTTATNTQTSVGTVAATKAVTVNATTAAPPTTLAVTVASTTIPTTAPTTAAPPTTLAATVATTAPATTAIPAGTGSATVAVTAAATH